MGAFWGGLWGFMFGSAFLFVSFFGPLLVDGPLVGWIIGSLEGAVIIRGVSAIGAGLCSLGIPKDSVVQYETSVRSGKFMVLAHGTADEVTQARGIIHRTTPESMAEHQIADGKARAASN